jgi:hypothetical protein
MPTAELGWSYAITLDVLDLLALEWGIDADDATPTLWALFSDR